MGVLAAMWSTDTTQFRVFISVLMVTTGSINTLAVKAADFVVAKNSDDQYVEFNHPVFQANIMMLGEMLCMLAYIVYTKCFQGAKDKTKDDSKDTPTPKWY